MCTKIKVRVSTKLWISWQHSAKFSDPWPICPNLKPPPQYTQKCFMKNTAHCSKTLFIIPTDAHNYKTRYTVHGSGRHECFPLPCTARLHNRLVCRHNIDHVINDEDNRIIIIVLAKHEIAPWWWFLREPKHVGAIVGILIVFNIPMILQLFATPGIINSVLILLMHGSNMKTAHCY
jgi:hypothetical protein